MRTKLGEAKWVGAAAAVVVIVGLTVGGVWAIKTAGGGGAQPEDVLPANAIAFTKLDLNPSAGQKVAAYRLASKFPKVKDKVTSEDTSIKESIFGSIFTGPTSKSGFGLDYKEDVEAWLGDRIGIGVFPDMDGDLEPEVGVAVAVTDQDAARVALDKAIVNAAKKVPALLSPKSAPPAPKMPAAVSPKTTGYAFTDGFVILSDTTAHATALAQAGKGRTLAGSTYAEDVKKVGSEQIGVAWADIAAVYKAIPTDQLSQPPLALNRSLMGGNDLKNVSGRVVMGLHADPSFLEVTGKAIDLKGVDLPVKGGAGTALLASFPADVLGAASITGLGKELAALYTSFTVKDDSLRIKSTLDQMGISSAKQIETLLGAETGLMVFGAGPTIFDVGLVYRTRSSDSDAALVIARRALRASPTGNGARTAKVTGPDGIVVGTGPAILGQSGSTLGATEAFRQVVPDAANADFAAYVNLAQGIPLLNQDPQYQASVKPLDALGMTATGGAEPTVRFRLSVK